MNKRALLPTGKSTWKREKVFAVATAAGLISASTSIALLLSLAVAPGARAQDRPQAPNEDTPQVVMISERSPSAAGVLEVFTLPTIGYAYAGNWRRGIPSGLVRLGGLGLVISQQFTIFGAPPPCRDRCVAGAVILGLGTVWALIDVVGTTKRENERRRERAGGVAQARSTAHSQQLVAGEAIRVRDSQSTEPDPQWTDATVVRLTPDTLWYQSGGSVSATSLDNVELKRPTFRNHRWAGLGIGALAGGAVGALAAYSSFEPRFGYEDGVGAFICLLFGFGRCDPGPQVQVNSRTEETAGGAVVGALTGGALGFFVGKVLGRWETVELDQVNFGAGNLAVSMSIRR